MKKKRETFDSDLASLENKTNSGNLEITSEITMDDKLNEPTMGQKLANLNLLDHDKAKISEKEEPSLKMKPPSADSVHILLKQALHAEDRALLLDCLYTQDEKVIANSTSLLNPTDIFKLLDFLVSIIQSRGTIVACALPWLRSLLLQHATTIISQESSLLSLNSLYQLIESRVSTFRPALRLSSCLGYLFAGITDEMGDEKSIITPVIYENRDESDEDAMETDRENENEEEEAINGFSDFGESEDMSD